MRKSPQTRKSYNTDGEQQREPTVRRAGPSREGHRESFTENALFHLSQIFSLTTVNFLEL